MINLDKPIAGVDYQEIPLEIPDSDQEQGTMMMFEIGKTPWYGFVVVVSNIKINGKTQTMEFAYHATDNMGQLTNATPQLNDFVGQIVEQLIRAKIDTGEIEFNGQDSSD